MGPSADNLSVSITTRPMPRELSRKHQTTARRGVSTILPEKQGRKIVLLNISQYQGRTRPKLVNPRVSRDVITPIPTGTSRNRKLRWFNYKRLRQAWKKGTPIRRGAPVSNEVPVERNHVSIRTAPGRRLQRKLQKIGRSPRSPLPPSGASVPKR